MCKKHRKKTINNLGNSKRIASVIIASLGPECLDGMVFGRVDGNYSVSLKFAELITSVGNESTPEEIFSQCLVNMATQLNQHGTRASCLLQLLKLGDRLGIA